MRYQHYDNEHRKTLATNHIYKYRTDILFKWLYEFKFTDYMTAFKLIGLDKFKGGYRFIRTHIEKGFLVRFNNVQLGDKVNLITLTPDGVKYLKAHGMIDEFDPYIRLKRLQNNSNMYHHLGTQMAVYDQLHSRGSWFLEGHHSYVEWESKQGDIRVDALITFKPNLDNEYYWTLTGYRPVIRRYAIEFERSSKSNKRIYYLLKEHDRNIELRDKYDGVLYYFDDPSIKAFYAKKFTQDVWPEFSLSKQSHRVVKTLREYTPKHPQSFMFVALED